MTATFNINHLFKHQILIPFLRKALPFLVHVYVDKNLIEKYVIDKTSLIDLKHNVFTKNMSSLLCDGK